MLLELSVVTNTQHHFLAARNCKEDRYGSLLLAIEHAGFLFELVTIGSWLSRPMTFTKLSILCHLPKSTICCILQQAARVAIFCLYRIFNSRASASLDVAILLNC